MSTTTEGAARQHSHRTDSRPATRSGTFVIGGDIPVHRLGFGAMQLTGDGVWGEPANHSEAIAVLRRAVEGLRLNGRCEEYYHGNTERRHRPNKKEISRGRGVVANTLNLPRNGAVGFNRLVRLRASIHADAISSSLSCQPLLHWLGLLASRPG